ncbi:hypothetical protein ACOSP7_027350 [Xanthoceras sorbifolium]
MWLAGTISDVVEFLLEPKGCWGKFLRVKVRIDITKPLKRGIRVWLEEFKTMITSPIKYEKLPEFCFTCGLVGHSLKEYLDEEARTCVINWSMSKYGGEFTNSDRKDYKAVRNYLFDSSVDTRKKHHLEIVSKTVIHADFGGSQGCVNEQNHIRSLVPVLSQGAIVTEENEVVVGNIMTEAVPNVNSSGDKGYEVEGSMMQGIEINFTSGNVEIGPNLPSCQVGCSFGPNLEDKVMMDTSKPVARKWKRGARGRPPNKGQVSVGTVQYRE